MKGRRKGKGESVRGLPPFSCLSHTQMFREVRRSRKRKEERTREQRRSNKPPLRMR